jgi:hypothetical protein
MPGRATLTLGAAARGRPFPVAFFDFGAGGAMRVFSAVLFLVTDIPGE